MEKGMQSVSPVYMPRQMQKGQRREDYDTTVAKNEYNLNLDLSILYEKLRDVEEMVLTLQSTIATLQSAVNALQS